MEVTLTVDLDEDVSEFVTTYAEARQLTFNAAISELVRKVQAAAALPPSGAGQLPPKASPADQ